MAKSGMNIPQQGMSQATSAMQQLYRAGLGVARAVRSAGRRRKKRAASSSGSRKRRATSRKGGKLKRLVKGSAAAKAYMAKIRKKRK